MANKHHAGHWIAGAVKHPGALHRALGVPQGQKIPAGKVAAAAANGGKVGQEARLAETLRQTQGEVMTQVRGTNPDLYLNTKKTPKGKSGKK